MRMTMLMAIAVTFGVFNQARSQTSIHITYSKTTSIVFQYPIINVDRGSGDLIAQRVRGVDNTLQIKAARRGFPETNLTVITADGNLHHFYVLYAERPETQTFIVDSAKAKVTFSERLNIKSYEEKANRILKARKYGRLEKDHRFKVQFRLNAIYIEGDQLFYDLSIVNKSNIGYDVQSLRFFIRDKKKVKRTASQEQELKLIFASNSESKVKGNSVFRTICVLEKFIIPQVKILDIELFEKNGGRNHKLRVKNNTIVKAKELPK